MIVDTEGKLTDYEQKLSQAVSLENNREVTGFKQFVNDARLIGAAFEISTRQKEYCTFVANRLRTLAATIDYDKLFERIDDRSKRKDSPTQDAETLFDAITSGRPSGVSVVNMVNRLEHIGSSKRPIMNSTMEIVSMFATTRMLERMSQGFLREQLPEQATLSQQRAEEMTHQAHAIIETLHAENMYQAQVSSPNHMVYHNIPLALGACANPANQAAIDGNPALKAAFTRCIDRENDRIKNLSLEKDNQQIDSLHEKRIADLRKMTTRCLLLEPQNEEQQQAVEGLSKREMLLDGIQAAPYLVNKLTRIVEQMPLKEAELPAMTIAEARAFFEDADHSLEIYSRNSQQCDFTTRMVIDDWCFAARGKSRTPPTDDELITTAQVLKWKVEQSKPINVEWRPLTVGERHVRIDLKAIRENQDYEYTTELSVATKTWYTQQYMFLPLKQVAAMVRVEPVIGKDGNPVILDVKDDEEYEAATYYFRARLGQVLAHEVGEQIVARLPYSAIRGYCEVFAEDAQKGRSFLTDYAHSVFTGSISESKTPDPARGIKEDFCEAVGFFFSSPYENRKLYETSPDRYHYILNLFEGMMPDEYKQHFREYYLANIGDNGDERPQPLPQTTEIDHKDSVTLGSTTVRAKRRITETLGTKEIPDNEIITLHIYGIRKI